jgi:hypothetical protein
MNMRFKIVGNQFHFQMSTEGLVIEVLSEDVQAVFLVMAVKSIRQLREEIFEETVEIFIDPESQYGGRFQPGVYEYRFLYLAITEHRPPAVSEIEAVQIADMVTEKYRVLLEMTEKRLFISGIVHGSI